MSGSGFAAKNIANRPGAAAMLRPVGADGGKMSTGAASTLFEFTLSTGLASVPRETDRTTYVYFSPHLKFRSWYSGAVISTWLIGIWPGSVCEAMTRYTL